MCATCVACAARAASITAGLEHAEPVEQGGTVEHRLGGRVQGEGKTERRLVAGDDQRLVVGQLGVEGDRDGHDPRRAERAQPDQRDRAGAGPAGAPQLAGLGPGFGPVGAGQRRPHPVGDGDRGGGPDQVGQLGLGGFVHRRLVLVRHVAFIRRSIASGCPVGC